MGLLGTIRPRGGLPQRQWFVVRSTVGPGAAGGGRVRGVPGVGGGAAGAAIGCSRLRAEGGFGAANVAVARRRRAIRDVDACAELRRARAPAVRPPRRCSPRERLPTLARGARTPARARTPRTISHAGAPPDAVAARRAGVRTGRSGARATARRARRTAGRRPRRSAAAAVPARRRRGAGAASRQPAVSSAWRHGSRDAAA